MNGIILAAGRGSRMGDLTSEAPKCLVNISGASLLHWQITSLKSAGINNIILVRGYMRELLVYDNIKMLDNLRWNETNMVSTLLCAAEYLRTSESIISYSDILYHPTIVKKLLAAQGDISLTYDRLWYNLWKERFENPLLDAETLKLENDTITEIGLRTNSMDNIQGQYMGLLKIKPSGWNRIESLLTSMSLHEQDKLDMTSLLQLLIKNGNKLQGVPIDGKWCEVDNQKDLSLYETKIKTVDSLGEAWVHDWR